MTSRFCYILALAGATVLGNLVLAQSPPTVWHALGIPQACKHIHASTFNRKGNHPGLEKKPPLKGLADPANLKSDVPAIKKAAEIKAQEDLAPQKIKALKYLAQIGCGCYGGVAEALTAALEDCTEEVRYQGALAIVQALSSNCQVCQKTCCTKALAAKMYERAYGQDADGCFIEPSERVRGVLLRALDDCPPDMRDVAPVDEIIDPLLDPGGGTPSLRDAPAAPQPEPPAAEALFPAPPAEISAGNQTGSSPSTSSSRRSGTQRSALLHRTSTSSITYEVAREDVSLFEPAPEVPMVKQQVTGEVIEGKSRRGFVRVLFDNRWQPPVGTELDVYHQYVLGTEFTGRLVIAEYEGAYAIAGSRAWDSVKVARGDRVQCIVMVPAPVSSAPAAQAMSLPAPPAPSMPLPTRQAAPAPVAAESAAEKRLDAPLLDILQPPPVIVEPEDEEETELVVRASTDGPIQPSIAVEPEPEHLAPIVLPPRVIRKK
jgi:hypothetical protein